MKILGFDPGIGRLGFGVVLQEKQSLTAADFGVIETPPNSEKVSRLVQIKSDLEELMEEIKPDLIAVEELFFVQNITTGIAVAEARGVILAVCGSYGVPLVEVKPTEIKCAICGNGQAGKRQVQEMVVKLLGLNKIPQPDDAADALAVAIAASQINFNLRS